MLRGILSMAYKIWTTLIQHLQVQQVFHLPLNSGAKHVAPANSRRRRESVTV